MKPPGTGLCVRYRYDETRRRRWKTVELIVEESDWEPTTPGRREGTLVTIQVAAQERGGEAASEGGRRQVESQGGGLGTALWASGRLGANGTNRNQDR